MTDGAALYLLEPTQPGAAWAPFGGVRPVAELRAGAWRIRERWEAAAGAATAAILGEHVAGFSDGDTPPVRPVEFVTGPAVVGVSWFAPSGAAAAVTRETRRLVHAGTTVGWIVPAGERWAGPSDTGAASAADAAADGGAAEIDGVLFRGAFDLLTALERLLAADCADFASGPGDGLPDGSIVLGDPALVVCCGAQIEPGVVFDVRHGAVVVERNAEIRHGTRLEGPIYVGPGTKVVGGFIRNSVFGPECRVRGEIASSVFLGYANKVHDGFVGHSVVGCWVNLGAGTTTSNLKNTYGLVRLDAAGEPIETGRLNVGTLFGDHAKTAIGTMLSTGSIVAAGANVFGTLTPPKYVPPFAWGCAGETMTEEGFLRVAERVLPRRGVALTPERRESLRSTFRRALGHRAEQAAKQ
jgi:UDP-N-acetylglucosamine diphosphorylase/glucosamine-1-phosphate N-acetyltransferase